MRNRSAAISSGVLIVALGAGVALAAHDYAAFDLGGPAPAQAFDINQAGRTVGSVTPDLNQSRATVWPRAGEAPIELLLPAGTNWSRAFGINVRARIVGQAQDRTVNPAQIFAVSWNSADDLPVVLRAGTVAVAVNDSGQIAGNMRTPAGAIHGAVWSEAGADPVDLGTLGGTSSSAADLNNDAQIVGQSRDAEGRLHAAFWNTPDTAPVDLGAPVSAVRAAATGINERGEIVGDFGTTLTERRALFWPAPGAVPMELQGLGGSQSQAVAINERGWIVGWAHTVEGQPHACLWTSAALPPVDLSSTDNTSGFARAINESGRIAGDEMRGTALRPVIWKRSPSPE